MVGYRKSLVFQIDHPALAITGVNNQQELNSVVLDIGIISVWYFLVMPVSLKTEIFKDLDYECGAYIYYGFVSQSS